MLIDSHCHLDRLDLEYCDGDVNVALDAARKNGVTKMLCISTDMARLDAMMSLVHSHSDIYASVGVHPLSDEISTVTEEALVTAADDPSVIALGETGLDYFYQKDTVADQQQSFTAHLKASSVSGKPVIIHTRQARQDTLNLIRKEGDPKVGGVLHCFTEDWDMARQAIEMNYFISFSGIISFGNADELREVVKKVPLERMLVETDSPWLTPAPHRGKSNEPKYVRRVAECIAQIKGISYDQVVDVTGHNFHTLFKL